MSERSQARRHPDDTRCQNEVRPDDALTTHDVRTKSEGCQTMSTGRLSFQHQSRRLHFLPFLSLNTRPRVSQMHAKGYPSFLSSPIFFPFKPGRMLQTYSGHTAPLTYTYSGHTATYNLNCGLSQPSIDRIRLQRVHRPTNAFHPVHIGLSVCVCMCVRNDVHVYRISFMFATAHKKETTEWNIL